MKKRIKLSAKMIILVLTASALIYITAISFIAFSLKQNALIDAKKLANEYAKDNARKVEMELNAEIAVSRTFTVILFRITLSFILYGIAGNIQLLILNGKSHMVGNHMYTGDKAARLNFQ